MDINIVTDLTLVVKRTLHAVRGMSNAVAMTRNSVASFDGIPKSEDFLRLSKDTCGVLWGDDGSTCIIATDRFGSIPVYVYETPAHFIF